MNVFQMVEVAKDQKGWGSMVQVVVLVVVIDLTTQGDKMIQTQHLYN